MGLIAGIWMILLGVLGAANLIIARKPDAEEWIKKLAPYQGWFGAISAIWGLWVLISCVLNLGLLSSWPLWWVTLLAMGLGLFSLGLLFGVGVLKSFITQPSAVEKIDLMVAKLSPFQAKLGLVAICVGVWGILAPILFTAA